MEFSTAQTVFLTISTFITMAAIISLLCPPLLLRSLRDREYIRMLIRHELEDQLSDLDVSHIVDTLEKNGAFDDRTRETYGER